MIGFYHSKDLDGYCSGAIMRLRYTDIKLIGYDYGQDFPFDTVKGEDVIMADLSLPMNQMAIVAAMAKSFTWIDHHVSAINDYSANYTGGSINAYTYIHKAACELTWEFLFRGNDTPLVVEMLGKYDSWRNSDAEEWNDKILPFQYGMRHLCNGVDSFPHWLLRSDCNTVDNWQIQKIINNGLIILEYQKQQNETYCIKSFEVEFEGLRAICLNTNLFNSTTFDSVWDEDRHDVMIPFNFNGKDFNFSLYTTKDNVDCSELAKKYGGGGHKKAAGFRFKDISILKQK